MSKSMMTALEVTDLIQRNKALFLAGSEKVIKTLPPGLWVAGTTSRFMTKEGGLISEDLIQVTILPSMVRDVRVGVYSPTTVEQIPSRYFKNGFSLITIPAGTAVLQEFARSGPKWSGIYHQPLAGWVTGPSVPGDPQSKAKVVDGRTGQFYEDRALVMHVELDPRYAARVNILNIFEPSQDVSFQFEEEGFKVQHVIVKGERVLAKEFFKNSLDVDNCLPIVADYLGTFINVSIKEVTEDGVSFFAPVFKGIEYKTAKPLNYERDFVHAMNHHGLGKPLFSCNCIKNFEYAKLEGKKAGDLVSPITYGEIAYALVNQTIVYLNVEAL